MTGTSMPISAAASKLVRASVQVVGLLILGAVVLRRVEWTAVAASYRGVAPPLALAAGLAVLAAMGLRLWKWHIQVRAMGFTDVPAGVVARGFLLGVLLGAVTPLRLGELYRIAAVTPGEVPGERTRAAGGVVLDKGYELFVVLVTLALGALLVRGPWWAWASAGIAAAVAGRLVLGRSPVRAGTGAWATISGAKRCLSRGQRMRLLAATVGAHALNMSAGLILWRAFGALSVGDFVVRIPLITLLNTVPITIGGFGLRELAAIELFGPVGYPAGAAAAAAASLFFAANVLPALVLLPCAAVSGWRRT